MINGLNFRTPTRGQKGFTLVEVIVVAIIVAALAAVAIPLYTSYVTSSHNNAAANAAGSVASFMGACSNQGGDITAVPTHNGSVNTIITCTVGTVAGATMNLPMNITIVISAIKSPGNVSATYNASGATAQVYNY